MGVHYMFQWHWMCRNGQGRKNKIWHINRTSITLVKLYHMNPIFQTPIISSVSRMPFPARHCWALKLRAARCSQHRSLWVDMWTFVGVWSVRSHVRESWVLPMALAALMMWWSLTLEPACSTALPTRSAALWAFLKRRIESQLMCWLWFKLSPIKSLLRIIQCNHYISLLVLWNPQPVTGKLRRPSQHSRTAGDQTLVSQLLQTTFTWNNKSWKQSYWCKVLSNNSSLYLFVLLWRSSLHPILTDGAWQWGAWWGVQSPQEILQECYEVCRHHSVGERCWIQHARNSIHLPWPRMVGGGLLCRPTQFWPGMRKSAGIWNSNPKWDVQVE